MQRYNKKLIKDARYEINHPQCRSNYPQSKINHRQCKISPQTIQNPSQPSSKHSHLFNPFQTPNQLLPPTDTLQMSTSGPYVLPTWKSSGAAYSGEPQCVLRGHCLLYVLLRPKSVVVWLAWVFCRVGWFCRGVGA